MCIRIYTGNIIKETVITSTFVIPAKAGIQCPIDLKHLDSGYSPGSSPGFVWNDELIRVSLMLEKHEILPLFRRGFIGKASNECVASC